MNYDLHKRNYFKDPELLQVWPSDTNIAENAIYAVYFVL